MAIMPHPERTLQNEADDLFKSMKKYISSGSQFSYRALNFASKKASVKKFKKPPKTDELLISTIIADNEAASVEKCINGLGIKAGVKKYIHFEIDSVDSLDIDSIISTDVLFNPSKEYVAKPKNGSDVHRFLVRSKDDIVGQSLTQTLQDRFDLAGLKSIKRGVVWEVKINSVSLKKDVDLILNSHIFSNPISQECHEY
jgi:phosphoribosylformylglycinamidine synthase